MIMKNKHILLTTVILNLGEVMWDNHASLIYKYLHKDIRMYKKDIYSVLYNDISDYGISILNNKNYQLNTMRINA